jgi:hypothetical protein
MHALFYACHMQVVLEAARREPAYQKFLHGKQSGGLTDVEFISLACLMQAKMGRVRRRDGHAKRWTANYGAFHSTRRSPGLSQTSPLHVYM